MGQMEHEQREDAFFAATEDESLRSLREYCLGEATWHEEQGALALRVGHRSTMAASHCQLSNRKAERWNQWAGTLGRIADLEAERDRLRELLRRALSSRNGRRHAMLMGEISRELEGKP